MATPDPLCLLEHTPRSQRLREPAFPSTCRNTQVITTDRDKAELRNFQERPLSGSAAGLRVAQSAPALPLERRLRAVALARPVVVGRAVDDDVAAVERGVALGVVAAGVGAAALLAGERAGGDQRARAGAVCEQRLRPLGVRDDAGVACRAARAWRARRPAARGARAGGRARRPRPRAWRRRARRARQAPRGAPKTKHSLSELDASRLAPCRPVQEDSPTAYRPAERRARVRSATTPPIV